MGKKDENSTTSCHYLGLRRPLVTRLGLFRDKVDIERPHTAQSAQDKEETSCSKSGGTSDMIFRILINVEPTAEEDFGEMNDSSEVFDLPSDSQVEMEKDADTGSLSSSLDGIKRRLLQRTFYTWLAYARCTSVVKKHLKTIVFPANNEKLQDDRSILTEGQWQALCDQEIDPSIIYQKIYFAGCDAKIRPKVWPYLLKVLPWSPGTEDKTEEVALLKRNYFHKRKEWQQLLQESRPQVQLSTEFEQLLESIEKDVVRCDRTNRFFRKRDAYGERNLDMLRHILTTYVWEHMDDGYTQGMCDLIAPLLALLLLHDDEEEKTKSGQDLENIEATVYIYFSQLMRLRVGKLFSVKDSSFEMDRLFQQLKHLVYVIDPELIYQMERRGELANFYFSYRWFLLDFKREFNYLDVYRVWETLLCAEYTVSRYFELFIALAMIEYYREVIVDTRMEFTEILRFFNERAEKHKVEEILYLARQFASDFGELVLSIS